MKRLAYLLLIGILVVCGCQKQVEKEVIIDRVNGIVDVEYSELIKKIEENHDFILYIGRADCQDCIEFESQLAAFLEEHPNLGVYYLDVKAFRDAARKDGASQKEKAFFENIQETLAYDWTPTLQHRRGKEVISDITYLDDTYYTIDNKADQFQAKQQSLENIWQWLKEEI